MISLTNAKGEQIVINVAKVNYCLQGLVYRTNDDYSYTTIFFDNDTKVYVRERVDDVLKILGSVNGGKSLQDE